MKDIHEIVALRDARLLAEGRRNRMRRRVLQVAEGGIAVPLPEIEEMEEAAVANLLLVGVNGTAQRIASVHYRIAFMPERAGVPLHTRRAYERTQAAAGWLEENDHPLAMSQRARYLIAYDSAPVHIRPWAERGFAEWHVRDPLDALPAPPRRRNDMLPEDCIFITARTRSWLRRTYPGALSFLAEPRGYNAKTRDSDDLVELVEYVDGDEHVLVATGKAAGVPGRVEADYGRSVIFFDRGPAGYRFGVELERTENLVGRCPVVIPGLITLGRPQGMFDDVIPKFMKRAKLDALEYIAIREGVFPRLWLVAHPSNVSGKVNVVTEADGPKGIVGEIEGGTIAAVNPQPGYKVDEAIARLEREERISGLVPAQYGGENPTNTRTARSSAELLAGALDFGIAEAHQLFQRAAEYEIELAVDTARAYFRRRQVSFHVMWKGASGPLTYRAGELFPDGTARPKVRYPMPGGDVNMVTQRVIQMDGSGLISKQTAREMHPEIDDPETEKDRVIHERLTEALLQEFMAPGSAPFADKAHIAELVLSNRKEFAEAVIQAQREAQERQATEGAPGTPTGPVDPGAPEAQPGLSPPGMGAEAGVAPAGPPDLASLLAQLGAGEAA